MRSFSLGGAWIRPRSAGLLGGVLMMGIFRSCFVLFGNTISVLSGNEFFRFFLNLPVFFSVMALISSVVKQGRKGKF